MLWSLWRRCQEPHWGRLGMFGHHGRRSGHELRGALEVAVGCRLESGCDMVLVVIVCHSAGDTVDSPGTGVAGWGFGRRRGH